MNDTDFGIGIDIQDTKRFELDSYEKNKIFLDKIFSKEEIEYSFANENSAEHLGVRFACKEAIIKALNSLGNFDCHYKDINISNDTKGIPSATLSNKAKNKYLIKISLSHSKGCCAAVAIVIRQNKS